MTALQEVSTPSQHTLRTESHVAAKLHLHKAFLLSSYYQSFLRNLHSNAWLAVASAAFPSRPEVLEGLRLHPPALGYSKLLCQKAARIHIYIYTYMYVYIYIFIYIYISVNIHICIYTHMYIHKYACAFIPIHVEDGFGNAHQSFCKEPVWISMPLQRSYCVGLKALRQNPKAVLASYPLILIQIMATCHDAVSVW